MSHWACAWQKQQNDPCAQQKLRSACASAQFDQSLYCPHEVATHWVHSKDSEQTGWMHRLIWVFVGCICHFVCFVMLRLILCKGDRVWRIWTAWIWMGNNIPDGIDTKEIWYFPFMKLIWAASWQNQQCGCAPSEESDQSGIRPVWSESSLCAQWVAKDPSYLHAHIEDWSDWADAQAVLSLRWAHMPFCWVLSGGGSYYFAFLKLKVDYYLCWIMRKSCHLILYVPCNCGKFGIQR